MKMYTYYVVVQPRHQYAECYYMAGPLSYDEAHQKKYEVIGANPDRDPLEVEVVTRIVDVE